MAWNHIRGFRSGMQGAIEYALRMVKDGAAFHSSVGSSEPKEIASIWKADQKLHNYKGAKKYYVVKQSFSIEDGKRSSLEDLKEVGRKTAEKLFPNHDFVVGQHTDTKNIHNHIIFNIVNNETGRIINNKYENRNRLMEISDKLCKEKGLSVIQPEEKLKVEKGKYDLEKQRKKIGRYAYVKDLKQKADLAKELSIDFKEYSSFLGAFDIKIRVEKDNISYLYPDKKRPIRGEKVGDAYERSNLTKDFIKNEERFRTNPKLRESFQSEMDKVKSNKNYVFTSEERKEFLKSVENFTSKGRREQRYMSPSEKDLGRIEFPESEIKKAKSNSIIDYANKKKIGLVKDDKGKTVLKGREHISVQNYSWKNNKNGTRGNIIDFVAIDKNVSFIKAVSILNDNPRLTLLEEHHKIKKMEYKSFHIPKDKRMNKEKAISHIGKLFYQKGWDSQTISPLMKRGQLQVDKKGRIFLFGESNDKGAYEFYQDHNKKWQKQEHGKLFSSFFKSLSSSKKGTLFLDPFSFMSQVKKNDLTQKESSKSILSLMKLNVEEVDRFVAEYKNMTELNIFLPKDKKLKGFQIEFISTLKDRYKSFGMSINISDDIGKSTSRDIDINFH